VGQLLVGSGNLIRASPEEASRPRVRACGLSAIRFAVAKATSTAHVSGLLMMNVRILEIKRPYFLFSIYYLVLLFKLEISLINRALDECEVYVLL
jgi:hypothetical protein